MSDTKPAPEFNYKNSEEAQKGLIKRFPIGSDVNVLINYLNDVGMEMTEGDINEYNKNKYLLEEGANALLSREEYAKRVKNGELEKSEINKEVKRVVYFSHIKEDFLIKSDWRVIVEVSGASEIALINVSAAFTGP